jgi:hypothetical protein
MTKSSICKGGEVTPSLSARPASMLAKKIPARVLDETFKQTVTAIALFARSQSVA